jgi:hypothetical protein
VEFTRELLAADGRLSEALRRCLFCRAPINARGHDREAWGRCGHCQTDMLVQRPNTGKIAQRFGLRTHQELAPFPDLSQPRCLCCGLLLASGLSGTDFTVILKCARCGTDHVFHRGADALHAQISEMRRSRSHVATPVLSERLA